MHRDADVWVVEVVDLAAVLDGNVHDTSLEASEAACFGRREPG